MLASPDDADLDYLSRNLFRTGQERPATHQEFIRLQREAASAGAPLPPSTLRAMIVHDLRAHEIAARSPLKTVTAAPSHTTTTTAANGLDAHRELAGLPDCVLLLILGALDAAALARAAVVSRDMAELVRASGDGLWEPLVHARYAPVAWALPPGALELRASPTQTWRERYWQLAREWPLLAASNGHASDESCWLVIAGRVYDVTSFMHRHPGMANALRLFGGEDATAAFEEVPHSALAHQLMRTLEVPRLRLAAEDFPPRFRAFAAEPAAPATVASRLESSLERLKTWVPESLMSRWTAEDVLGWVA